MTKITHKKAQEFYERYQKSTAYRLTDVYNSCSYEKVRAFDEILSRAISVGGNVRIIGANSSFFTTAYITDDGKIVVDTYCNTFIGDI